MKKIIFSLGLILLSFAANAQTGLFFNVIASGATFTITTVHNPHDPNHLYPRAGIKITTPGHSPGNCTQFSNGYCLFSVSETQPATITISGTPGRVSFILCLAGDGLPNPMTCQHYAHDVGSSTATLTSSVSALALSVNNPTYPRNPVTGPALTGNSRTITIQNTGPATAQNVTVSPSGFPAGTSITADTCTGPALAPSATCTITITPGATETTNCGTGTVPTPGTVQVSASNTNTVSVDILVLTYGCQYQGGYIFDVDDTTSSLGSIGGKVASLVDQSGGFNWSSSLDSIYGIAETSMAPATPVPNPGPPQPYTGQTACNGNRDGVCDSTNIDVFYTNNPGPTYAANLCDTTIDGFKDWYLPAICEQGYGAAGPPPNCGFTVNTAVLQNMQANLVSNGNIGSLSGGTYWSSTEYSLTPNQNAWQITFGVGPVPITGLKNVTNRVRCARQITQP